MSFVRRDNDIPLARCSKCDADLATHKDKRKKAYVYCTERKCHHYSNPHPTGPELNRGRVEL